jgi:hypothetical protein
MHEQMQEYEKKGCSTPRHWPVKVPKIAEESSFQKEYEYQRQKEIKRAATYGRLANKKINKRKEKRNKHKKQILRLAGEHGYRSVMYALGLHDAIKEIIKGEKSIRDYQNVVIELYGPDKWIRASQVPGPNTALYWDDDIEVIVMLKNCGESIVEHTGLMDIRNPYVTILGVEPYRTLLGTRQAFVIEMAW